MRRLTYILTILITIAILSGCTQGTSAEPEEHGSFSPMAQLHITVAELPGDEYTEAEVSASWTGEALERVPVEIKLRGNTAKESEKKSYNIKFAEACEFLGMDAGKKWAVNGNPFDKSLLRLVVGFDYAKAVGLNYVPDTRLCHVWLNGTDMGVYTVIEPVEAGAGRVEIDVEQGDFLLERNTFREEEGTVYMTSSTGMRFEYNEPEEPDKKQQKRCYTMLEEAETAIITADHTIYEKYIDVESFVNFYIFHEVMKDIDFGDFSTRYYMKDGILYAGPPWDLDLTMGNVSTEKDEYKYDKYHNADTSGDSTQELWADEADYYFWLWEDPWFRKQVQQRWQALYPVTAQLSVPGGLIDQYLQAYQADLEANFAEAGWNVSVPEHVSEWQNPAEDYAGNVELLRSWLQQRTVYLNTQFGN